VISREELKSLEINIFQCHYILPYPTVTFLRLKYGLYGEKPVSQLPEL
jgi:hypothetical protein